MPPHARPVDENGIVQTQVEQSPCGLKRLSDAFPGLTDEGKEFAREKVRPLFVYCSDGLSEQTHGFLFMLERGGVRMSQRTWAKTRDIRLTPPSKSPKVAPKRAERG